jgi:hypothetical protein
MNKKLDNKSLLSKFLILKGGNINTWQKKETMVQGLASVEIVVEESKFKGEEE